MKQQNPSDYERMRAAFEATATVRTISAEQDPVDWFWLVRERQLDPTIESRLANGTVLVLGEDEYVDPLLCFADDGAYVGVSYVVDTVGEFADAGGKKTGDHDWTHPELDAPEFVEREQLRKTPAIVVEARKLLSAGRRLSHGVWRELRRSEEVTRACLNAARNGRPRGYAPPADVLAGLVAQMEEFQHQEGDIILREARD